MTQNALCFETTTDNCNHHNIKGKEQTERDFECYSVCEPLAHHIMPQSLYFPEAGLSVSYLARGVLRIVFNNQELALSYKKLKTLWATTLKKEFC